MNDQLKQSVMRRAHLAYALRRASSPTMIKLYVMAVFVWQLTSAISISSVLANSPKITDPMYLADFFGYAFMHTELLAKLLIIGAFILVLWLLRDVTASAFKTLRPQESRA